MSLFLVNYSNIPRLGNEMAEILIQFVMIVFRNSGLSICKEQQCLLLQNPPSVKAHSYWSWC